LNGTIKSNDFFNDTTLFNDSGEHNVFSVFLNGVNKLRRQLQIRPKPFITNLGKTGSLY
jgi:hypothetical protein